VHLWARRVDVINSFLGIGISKDNSSAFCNVIHAHKKKKFLKEKLKSSSRVVNNLIAAR